MRLINFNGNGVRMITATVVAVANDSGMQRYNHLWTFLESLIQPYVSAVTFGIDIATEIIRSLA